MRRLTSVLLVVAIALLSAPPVWVGGRFAKWQREVVQGRAKHGLAALGSMPKSTVQKVQQSGRIFFESAIDEGGIAGPFWRSLANCLWAIETPPADFPVLSRGRSPPQLG